MPAGRPSIYSPELAIRICEQLATGKSLRTVCKQDGMPDISTIYDWFPKHPEFAEQYARAKQDSADALIEEINDIADNGTNDWMELHDPDNPGYKAHGEHIQRSRLRVDTKKWIASKMKPKKYGDVTNLNVAGPDGQPLSFTVNVTGK